MRYFKDYTIYDGGLMGRFAPISTVYKTDGKHWWIKSSNGWFEINEGSDWDPVLANWEEISEKEAFLEIL